jgi:hypothetical protein
MENCSNDTLSIPPALVAGINAVADEENRPAVDVLQDVIQRGLEDRRWKRVLDYGAQQAKRLGLTEADIPRLIAERRRESRQLRWDSDCPGGGFH